MCYCLVSTFAVLVTNAGCRVCVCQGGRFADSFPEKLVSFQ